MDDSTPVEEIVTSNPVEDATSDSATSAETVNTEPSTTQEHMIPKGRFDEVNNELKTLRAAQQKAEKEREAAETKALEEQNNFKALYEKAQAEAAQAAKDLQAVQLASLKQSVAAELGLPQPLISRLVGESKEDIEADAKLLLESLPKPSAPNVGNTTGDGNAPANGEMTEAQKLEMAATFGVMPQYIK